jgi:hypothetical protein
VGVCISDCFRDGVLPLGDVFLALENILPNKYITENINLNLTLFLFQTGLHMPSFYI